MQLYFAAQNITLQYSCCATISALGWGCAPAQGLVQINTQLGGALALGWGDYAPAEGPPAGGRGPLLGLGGPLYAPTLALLWPLCRAPFRPIMALFGPFWAYFGPFRPVLGRFYVFWASLFEMLFEMQLGF